MQKIVLDTLDLSLQSEDTGDFIDCSDEGRMTCDMVKEMETVTEMVKVEIFLNLNVNGISLVLRSLDEIEDPCDLYNYISENCPII